MTYTLQLPLFALRTLLQSDYLAWLVGLPILLFAVVMLVVQYRRHRQLTHDLKLLDKMQLHSVEYDLVLKAMRLAVFRIDVPTYTITFESDYRDASDSFTTAPGTPLADIFTRIHTDASNKISTAVDNLIHGRQDVAHLQYQMNMPYGSGTYWSELYATVDKRDIQGRPLSIVGTVGRIDQQKQAEQDLHDALFHAEESDRLKSAFLANISHEIRTPLNAIVGFSDVLTMVDDAEERQNLIHLIKQNNSQLLRIFDDMVSMAALEARAGEAVQKNSFPLRQLFDDVIDKYKEEARDRGLALVVEDADRLPVITTDRDALFEILRQYTANALKFTNEGQVTLGCTDQMGHRRIWVRDTGIGIPPEQCNDELFERFFKIDEFTPGTGLGLSICRAMAHTLGAVVGFESQQGQGSVFWVEPKREE